MMESSAVTNDVRRASLRRMPTVAASEAEFPLHHLCGALVDGKVDEMAAFRDVVRKVAYGALL